MNLRLALFAGCAWLLLGEPASATVFELTSPDAVVLGREERVLTTDEDTLYAIAQRFSLGSEEVVRVNPGVDPWLPRAGRSIVIPGERILPSGPRDGIVVNLPEHRLIIIRPGSPARRSVCTRIRSASARWTGAPRWARRRSRTSA